MIANDPIGAHPGDSVIVESSSKRLLGIAALVYLLPILLFFFLYFLSGSLGFGEIQADVTAVAGFVLGIVVAVIYNRKEKKKGSVAFTVTSIKG